VIPEIVAEEEETVRMELVYPPKILANYD